MKANQQNNAKRIVKQAEYEIRAAGERESMPFVVELPVPPNFVWPSAITFEQVKGLLFCFIVVDPERGKKLTCCWTTRDCYEAQFDRLLTLIGIDPRSMPAWLGYFQQLEARNVAWWKKLSFLSICLAATTVLATYTAFRDNFREWFAIPHVAITEAELADAVDLVAGTKTTLRFKVRNLSQWWKATVVCTNISVLASNGSRVVGIDMNRDKFMSFPLIDIGGTEEVALPIEVTNPGRYKIQIDGSVRCGQLVPAKAWNRSFDLNVWRRREFLPVQKVVARGTNRAELPFRIASGEDYPQGLRCEALLANVPGVFFRAIVPSETFDPRRVDTKGAEVVLVTWTTPPLKKFTERVFVLYVESVNATELSEWAAFSSKIQFNFSD